MYHDEIVPTIFEAFNIATSGCPGPVFIKIPVNIQILKGECGELPVYQMHAPAFPAPEAINAAMGIKRRLTFKSKLVHKGADS